MKTWSLSFALIFTISAFAATESAQIATKADAETAPAPKKWSASFSQYRYELEGTNTATTNIYKFGEGQVDLSLFTLTYQASPKWTLLTFLPYIKNTVETIYEPVPGGFNLKLTDVVDGVGDVRFMAMNLFHFSGKNIALYDVGFTLPTGLTDRKFPSVTTGQGASYNMQPGTGTVDLIGGVTYSHLTTSKWTQNARAQYTARTGATAKGYSLGNEVQANASTKYQVHKYLNTGLQFNYKNRAAVDGKDTRYERFNNWQSPAARGDGHQYYRDAQIDMNLSVISKAEYKTKTGQTFALEAGVPLWQDAINKDDIRFDTRYWVSGTVGSAF